MPDDRFDHEHHEGDEPDDSVNPSGELDIPASVAFMEMMRQAAARSKPKPNIWADPATPPRRPRQSQPPTPPPVGEGLAPTASSNAPSVGEGLVPPTSDPVPLGDEQTPPASDAESPPQDSVASPVHPEHAAAMEAQRIQRIKRRKTRRRRRTVGVLGGIVRSVMVVFAAAAIMATIFTWWTPSGFLKDDVRQELSVAMATSAVTLEPTGLPTPNWLRRVGIVSGHRGPEDDPGAVCPDGLTEASINFNVAQLVVRSLRGRGYTVDHLDEFDPRLDNYQAAALVSIHANTCQDWGEVVSGFLVAAPVSRVSARGNDEFLVNCIAQHYASASALQRREGVTGDMTDYHSFREIDPLTPGAIIELGFLLADRRVLTEQPDVLARGITDGIICFLEPGAAPTPAPPTPAGV